MDSNQNGQAQREISHQRILIGKDVVKTGSALSKVQCFRTDKSSIKMIPGKRMMCLW